MHSAHTDNAYDLLEQSLNDAPLLKSHKNLPRRFNDSHNVVPSAAPFDVRSFSDDETSNGFGSELLIPLASPPLIHQQGSGLPPTPPSALNENGQQANHKPPQLADGSMSSLTSRRPLAVTPINQRSPPTPDPSPPRTAERTAMLERPTPIHYPSSRADSFKTAQENVDTSDDDADASRSQLSFHDALTPTFARPRMEMPSAASVGLGLELDDNSADLTPTQRDYDQDSYFDGANGDVRSVKRRSPSVDDIPNREWDTNFMRNVTVRRRRVPSAPANPGSSADPPTPSSTMKRGSSLRERAAVEKQSPRSVELESFAKEIGWPTEVDNILNSHLRDPNSSSKRFSTTSASSTVIEAVVVATPQHRQRALRHSGKNIALRQSSRSKRTSVSSDDAPPHRLVHKRSHIPERRNRDSIFSDGDTNETAIQSTTPHRPRSNTSDLEVPKRRESYRTSPVHRKPNEKSRSFTDPQESRSHAVHDANAGEGYFDVARSAPRALSEASPPRTLRRQHQGSPLTTRTNGLRHSTAPAVIKRTRETVTLEYSPTSSQESSFRRSAPNHPVLNRKESLLSTPEEKGFVSAPPAALEAGHLLHEHPSDSPRPRMSLDRASTRTEEIMRPSLEVAREERARASTESSPRLMSLDRSFMRTENEHSLARHHVLQTPFSQFSLSEAGDPPQVSEATAVSIYPHNNNSLLVVQQVARTNTQFSQQRIVSSPASPGSPIHYRPSLELPQPPLLDSPSTPPQQMLPEINLVESPLKNPRKPPEPPVLKIIPATPAEELERQLGDPSAGDRGVLSECPVQRLTLVQRARRYSDTFIQPILRTASVRRITAPQRSPRRAPDVHSNPPADNNLHPFWKPRGFWDDFSSDDEESLDLADDPIGEYEHRRLPQGGDTSDVGERNEQHRRRIGTLGRRLTDGFKGHGGFLIGNSLGLDRNGTNNRRHHVSVPVAATMASHRLDKKQSMHSLNSRAGAGPSTSASTVVRRHSPSPSERQRRTISTFSASTVEQPEDFFRGRGAAEREKQKQLKQQQKRLGGGGITKREYRMPGGWKVEYVGLRGMRDRLRERRAEKRRERLRRNIGQRFYVESTGIVV